MADPAEKHEGLTVARYAEVSAHLRHFAREPSAAVLVRLGLTTEAWGAAKAACARAIDDDVATGDGALVVAFAAAFAETRRRLDAGEDLVAPEAAAATPAPPPVEAPLVSPPIAPPPIAPPPHVAPHLASSAESRWARPPMPSGLRETDADPLNATVSVDPERLKALVVPFAEAPPRAPVPVPAPGVPPVDRPRAAVTGTTALHVGSYMPGALPFAKDSPAPPAQPAASTPPASAPSILTIEQYASLSAEISLAPEHTAAIRARYFIAGHEALRALQLHWQERRAADAALDQRVHALIAQYRAWLLQQRKE